MASDNRTGGPLPVILALVLGFVVVGTGVWWYQRDFHSRFVTPLQQLTAPRDSLQQIAQRTRRDGLLADSLRRVIGARVEERLAQRQQERLREDSLGRAAARRVPPDSLEHTPRPAAPLEERDLQLVGNSLLHLPPEAAARVLQRLGTREALRVLERLDRTRRQALLDSLPGALVDSLGLAGPLTASGRG